VSIEFADGYDAGRRDSEAVQMAMTRRLTALWRWGVAVLPPQAPDFHDWLAELDAAIAERARRA
jgi:hypothetical protein